MSISAHEVKTGARTDKFWLRQEPLDREKLVAANVDLVTLLERARDHALTHLDGEVDLVYRAEDFVDAADDGLVLEVDGGVEVGDLVRHERLAEHLVFDRVHERAHL